MKEAILQIFPSVGSVLLKKERSLVANQERMMQPQKDVPWSTRRHPFGCCSDGLLWGSSIVAEWLLAGETGGRSNSMDSLVQEYPP